MVDTFDNLDASQRRQVDWLVKVLGIEELFERVDALDGKGTIPEKSEFNPTNNPMVKEDETYQVASLSGGPNEWNQGDLSVVDPDHLTRINRLAEEEEARRVEAEETQYENEDARTEETQAQTDQEATSQPGVTQQPQHQTVEETQAQQDKDQVYRPGA